jgi:hypothetical protein
MCGPRTAYIQSHRTIRISREDRKQDSYISYTFVALLTYVADSVSYCGAATCQEVCVKTLVGS